MLDCNFILTKYKKRVSRKMAQRFSGKEDTLYSLFIVINKHLCSSIHLVELSNYIRLRYASRNTKYMDLLKFTHKLNEQNSIHHLSMKEKVMDHAVVRVHLVPKKYVKWVWTYLHKCMCVKIKWEHSSNRMHSLRASACFAHENVYCFGRR